MKRTACLYPFGWGVATLIGLALSSTSIQAGPAVEQEAQIDALSARIDALEARLGQLEAIGEARLAGNVILPEPVPGGWRKAFNWGLIEKGMEESAVEGLLGPPERTKKISKFEHWLYGDGRLRFYLGRLKSWELPSNLETE